ncbi:MAG: hypothetical protein KTM48_01895, partial [Wolbachia endosymbiont of Pissodes strobi]|nr:hypothetical protein [Wolbachia endosymbiont of Pissodes strobi]
LISRSYRLTKPTQRQEEIKLTTNALKQNGYSGNNIRKAINQQKQTRKKPESNEEQNLPKAILPYIKGVTDKVGRILRKHKIKPIFKPQQTLAQVLGNPKDKVQLENQGVYSIPCGDCQKSYIGQTNRRISTRIQEHKNSIRTKQTTSALFQHHLTTGHSIDFNNARQVATV